jgi:hypothetical protein
VLWCVAWRCWARTIRTLQLSIPIDGTFPPSDFRSKFSLLNFNIQLNLKENRQKKIPLSVFLKQFRLLSATMVSVFAWIFWFNFGSDFSSDFSSIQFLGFQFNFSIKFLAAWFLHYEFSKLTFLDWNKLLISMAIYSSNVLCYKQFITNKPIIRLAKFPNTNHLLFKAITQIVWSVC